MAVKFSPVIGVEIEICENVVLSRIDITMTTINTETKWKLIKAEFCAI